jgi:hypothetical protein
VETVTSKNLDLLTPNGLPSFKGGRGVSTIDLAFSTSSLANRLAYCDIDDSLCYNSDHKLIALYFLDLDPSLALVPPYRQWKKLNKELIAKLDFNLLRPPPPLSLRL